MWEDPIVKEVRQAGEEAAKKYKYNIHLYIESLRKNEKIRNVKAVSNIITSKAVIKNKKSAIA